MVDNFVPAGFAYTVAPVLFAFFEMDEAYGSEI